MTTRHPRLVYGHRGAPRVRPENTLPSFAHALELGANALELDVHETADGVLVVSHDPDGRRSCGVPKELRRTPLAGIRSWDAGFALVDASGNRPFAGKGIRLPTLDEVLEAFPGVPLNVDVKPDSPSSGERAAELVLRHGAQERVTLASFHPRVLHAIRRRSPALRTCWTTREVLRLALTPAVLDRVGPPRGTALQVPRRVGRLRLDTPSLIARAHRQGSRVDYWVIDEPDEARALFEAGADGIVTDEPGLLTPLLR